MLISRNSNNNSLQTIDDYSTRIEDNNDVAVEVLQNEVWSMINTAYRDVALFNLHSLFNYILIPKYSIHYLLRLD